MQIEVYADVVDATTALVKKRVDAAVPALRERGVDLTLAWRPFLTDPTAPRPSVPVAELADNPVFAAWQSATSPESDVQWRASSWAAHRLIAAAVDHGSDVQTAVVDAFVTAHLGGEDVNRLPVLQSIAARFALPAPIPSVDGEYGLVYLEPGFGPDDPYERRTREALLVGAAIGVDRSPTIVVNEHTSVVGVQPVNRLVDQLLLADRDAPRVLPDPVRRLRLAQQLLDDRRDPRGCLYLLQPLRPEYDGERTLETLTARALVASASLKPARRLLEGLVRDHPDDAHLHHLLGRTLRRLGETEAAQRHLTIAAAMDPTYDQ